jgi:hypothetical protein
MVTLHGARLSQEFFLPSRISSRLMDFRTFLISEAIDSEARLQIFGQNGIFQKSKKLESGLTQTKNPNFPCPFILLSGSTSFRRKPFRRLTFGRHGVQMDLSNNRRSMK